MCADPPRLWRNPFSSKSSGLGGLSWGFAGGDSTLQVTGAEPSSPQDQRDPQLVSWSAAAGCEMRGGVLSHSSPLTVVRFCCGVSFPHGERGGVLSDRSVVGPPHAQDVQRAREDGRRQRDEQRRRPEQPREGAHLHRAPYHELREADDGEDGREPAAAERVAVLATPPSLRAAPAPSAGEPGSSAVLPGLALRLWLATSRSRSHAQSAGGVSLSLASRSRSASSGVIVKRARAGGTWRSPRESGLEVRQANEHA